MKRSAKGAAVELTDSLDFLIRDTRLRLYKYIEGRMARQDIPLRLWFPLRALYWNEGITQRELGRMLGFGDAHAGVIVEVMRRRRLVDRQPSRIDKRRIDLFLTPAGRKMARLTLRHMRNINARIVAGFSATEARALQALLLRAHDNLEAS
jgi:MarR family transcriptional regulator, organic hydroperoxide resistance regulator